MRCKGFGGHVVDVCVPAAMWPSVETLLTGFLHTGAATGTGAAWRIVARPGESATAGRDARHYGDYADTGIWREVDGERRTVTLTALADTGYLPIHVVRQVRTLLRLAVAEADASALFLHAGMVRWAGTGIAVAGDKRSGKTSTLIAAAAVGAAFVSNDDLMLQTDPSGPVGIGWPRSVSIRLDTLTPLGITLPPDNQHPANRHRDESRLLMPHELSRALGSELVGSAPAGAIVFPMFDPAPGGSVLRRLDAGAAADRLTSNLLTVPVKDPELAALYRLPSEAELAERVRLVAGAVPAYELRQTLDGLGRADDLRRLLDRVVTAG